MASNQNYLQDQSSWSLNNNNSAMFQAPMSPVSLNSIDSPTSTGYYSNASLATCSSAYCSPSSYNNNWSINSYQTPSPNNFGYDNSNYYYNNYSSYYEPYPLNSSALSISYTTNNISKDLETKNEASSLSESNYRASFDSSSKQTASCVPVSSTAVSTANVTRASRKHQLPDKAVDILNEWFDDHLSNPYPSPEQKEKLARQGDISVKQVNAWFSNRRNRSQNTKPKRMKRVLEFEINNIFNELVNTSSVNKQQVIEKFHNKLAFHEIGL